MSYYGPSRPKIEKRNAAIEWARDVLANKDKYLILDTETTGLDDDDVLVHFAAMNLDRNMLVDSPVRPTHKKRIHPTAKEMHGFSIKDLKTAPIFEKVLESFMPHYEGRKILSYYARFHYRMIDHTIEQDGIARHSLFILDFICIQEKYEDFYGRTYLAMPGRDNTGVGDCNAALDVIEEMAAAELSELPEEQEPAADIIATSTDEFHKFTDRILYGWTPLLLGSVLLFTPGHLLGGILLLWGVYFLWFRG